MEQKDICFVGYNVESNVADYILSDRNLGLALLASSVRKGGYTADIINPLLENLTLEQTLDRIRLNTYSYFGFSVLDHFGWLFTRQLISRLRKNGYTQKFILGGNFPTVYYQQIFKELSDGELDFLCRGEGEFFIIELLDRLKNGEAPEGIDGLVYKKNGQVFDSKVREHITDLDTVPFAADDELENCKKKYQPVNLFSSRGCYGNCIYCSSNKLFFGKGHNRWRSRSVKSVVDEIEVLVTKHHTPQVSFMDDNFIGPGVQGKQRAIDICDEIVKRGLKLELFMECRPDGVTGEVGKALARGGFKLVFLGIESGSDPSLKELHRGNITKEVNKRAVTILAANKIEVSSGFIMYTPNCTFRELKENIDFLKFFVDTNYRSNIITMRIGFLMFSDLVLVRGSEIREIMERDIRQVQNKYMYISTDPDVQLLRYIVHDYDLYQSVYEIEESIRKTWIIPEIIQKISDETDIAKIKGYEKELVYMIADLMYGIMGLIEQRNLNDLQKLVLAFKKQLIVFANRKKKEIKEVLDRYR